MEHHTMAKKKQLIDLSTIEPSYSLSERLRDEPENFIADFQEEYPDITRDEVLLALLSIHRTIVTTRE
jgi:hypothetical protein